MSNAMINVLVTSVGGGVGQSVVDSLSLVSGKFRVVGLDLNQNIYARVKCDSFYLSPRISAHNYLDFLVEICVKEGVNVLIPGNDGELELLSENKSKFYDVGVEVVVSPPGIVTSSRNKYTWCRDYSELINIVPTYLYNDYIHKPELLSESDFPVIVKPAAGSASQGIKIYLSSEELLGDVLPPPIGSAYIVQPYLMPKSTDPDYGKLASALKRRELVQLSEISCQFVYDKDSNLLGYFASKNSLKAGVPVSIEPIKDLRLIEEIEAIGNLLATQGVVGPVNMQGRLTERGLVFFEMNLRFTGITGNRALFGFNEVAAVIDSFISQRNVQSLLRINSCRQGARQVACTTTYPLGSKVAKTLLITGAGSLAAKNFVIRLCEDEINHFERIILSTSAIEQLSTFLGANSTCVDIDVIGSSISDIASVIHSADILINFASARPPHGVDMIYRSTLFNIELADLLKHSQVGLVLNMSSQSVYSRKDHPMGEESAVSPQSHYTFSKLVGETCFNQLTTFNREAVVVNLRLGRLWGGRIPMEQSQFPVRLLNTLLGKDNIKVSNPNNQMSMLDVDDLSNALINIVNLWESGEVLPKVINLGGHNVTLDTLLASLKQELIKNGTECYPITMEDKEQNLFVIDSRMACTLRVADFTDISNTWSKLIATQKANLL